MKFCSYIVSLAVLALLSASCADRIVSECENSGNFIPDGDMTFGEIQSEIFTTSCALGGCHTGQFAAAALDLSAGKAYENLVNVASRQDPSRMLVLPENSGRSYIVKKLKGDNTSVMPPGGILDSAVIEAVAGWIDSGAVDN